jgi:hypothetical protein
MDCYRPLNYYSATVELSADEFHGSDAWTGSRVISGARSSKRNLYTTQLPIESSSKDGEEKQSQHRNSKSQENRTGGSETSPFKRHGLHCC